MSKIEIGKWIRHIPSKRIVKVQDMFRDGYTDYCTPRVLIPRTKWDSGIYGDMYDIKDVELWVPKFGEVCWYPVEGNDKAPHLIRFDGNHFYEYCCEPFTNSLPEYYKDKE